MRKPILIEKAKAGVLYKYCVERAHWIDLCGKVEIVKGGLLSLTGNACTLANHALGVSLSAQVELGFADSDCEPSELTAREYLRAITE